MNLCQHCKVNRTRGFKATTRFCSKACQVAAYLPIQNAKRAAEREVRARDLSPEMIDRIIARAAAVQKWQRTRREVAA